MNMVTAIEDEIMDNVVYDAIDNGAEFEDIIKALEAAILQVESMIRDAE